MNKPQITTGAVASTGSRERRALRRKREAEEVTRRYESGESIRQIAKAMGRGYGTIHDRLRAAGVTMRSRGGPNNKHVDPGV